MEILLDTIQLDKMVSLRYMLQVGNWILNSFVECNASSTELKFGQKACGSVDTDRSREGATWWAVLNFLAAPFWKGPVLVSRVKVNYLQYQRGLCTSRRGFSEALMPEGRENLIRSSDSSMGKKAPVYYSKLVFFWM